VFPADATVEQRVNHLLKVELPPILLNVKTSHHVAFNEKVKKEIVTGTTLLVIQKMAALEPLCEGLRTELRRDPATINAEALTDGQLRARCCQAIKVILDKHSVPKDGRPLFFR
jgi:hypothetical protein